MDMLTVVIIAALVATLVTMGLGLLAMSGGGEADRDMSEPLMWARIGFQALTIVLLILAVILR